MSVNSVLMNFQAQQTSVEDKHALISAGKEPVAKLSPLVLPRRIDAMSDPTAEVGPLLEN